jgi:hypothetical protein
MLYVFILVKYNNQGKTDFQFTVTAFKIKYYIKLKRLRRVLRKMRSNPYCMRTNLKR